MQHILAQQQNRYNTKL